MPAEPPSDQALRTKLAAELDLVPWRELRSHAEADRVFFVGETVLLLDVAVAIAGDAMPRVDAWIRAGEIGRPTQGQLDAWATKPDLAFRCVIVAPYVLIQHHAS
jgi:hypothetical protein